MKERKKYVSLTAFLLPVFVGGYTVLNFLETNIAEVDSSDALVLLIGVLVFSTGIYFLLRLLHATPFQAALISSLIIISMIYTQMGYQEVRYLFDEEIFFSVYIGILVAFMGVLALIIMRTKSTLELPVMFFTIATGISVLISSANIVVYEISRTEFRDAFGQAQEDLPLNLRLSGEKRNILYLVFDRYGDERTLMTDFNYDNSEFISFLRNMGFFVASRSSANYPKTAQSLSSSLNMAYHNFTEDQLPSDKSDWMPFYLLLRNNKVTALLKKMGYKYAHMGSWWPATATSPFADENFQKTPLKRFELKYLHRSIFASLLNSAYDGEARQSIEPEHCMRVPKKFERLRKFALSKEPTFVFAHFLVPHDPYVFDKHGHCMNMKEVRSRSLEENYIGQVEYVNKLVTEFVKTILTQPGLKPIIILQADEGPFPVRYRNNESEFQWKSASVQEIRKKIRILNTYFFPDVNPDIFYDHITPVNSFRLLFNTYFGMEYPLLPDVNYAFPNDENRYDFYDVTGIVR